MNFLRKIYYRLFSITRPIIRVEISREAILHNFSEAGRVVTGAKIAPVLKSNAYGHGGVLVARILRDVDAPFFVVDSLYEARELRIAGVTKPLLVIGYVFPENISRTRLRNIQFTITSIEQLRILARMTTKKTLVHIKFDTGMHRQGVLPSDIDEIHRILSKHPYICVIGICSHLADADGESEDITRQQIEKWRKIVDHMMSLFPQIQYRHISNTAGVYFHNSAYANVIRFGIGLYGFNVSRANLALKPAMRIISQITSIRKIRKEEGVGYNHMFQADIDRQIASVPIGYAEGIDRGLSNNGYVYVRGVACPIVGRVSMNITSIDVTAVPDVQFGDEVIVLSNNPGDKNSVEHITKAIERIPYEMVARIPAHLWRVAVE